MGERVCRYCQRSFQPSKFQPAQAACSDSVCQRRRRSDYHRRKVAADPVYRQGCLESAQQWRAEHPGYWTRLLEHNPARAERNRQRQRQRDERRRQRRLANNNSAPNLANNSPAIPQIIESKALNLSCQQQPSGQVEDARNLVETSDSRRSRDRLRQMPFLRRVADEETIPD